MDKKHKILIKELGIEIEVSKRTYYKIFNNEVGLLKKDGYEIDLATLKKYKKLFNSIRRE